ncbi:hypothetical protein POV27_07580 [Aureisphaera galaxeae]|uniref:hypothetical protein n=1 Tax=Aureisphaera galaxeae TaxID=1538023 RepID=UPI002350ABDA|nr:hypothetical protein [Aureisphaera galaxeae]MDC8003908.1 hypothetical protein [Aureisphaera galaxeae]
MIALKSIPDPSYFELNRLADYEAYFFVFIAILLILVFFKMKTKGRSQANQVSPSSIDNSFEYESRDVLMQPKKQVDEFEVPFKNFSLHGFYIAFGIVFIITFCSLYS